MTEVLRMLGLLMAVKEWLSRSGESLPRIDAAEIKAQLSAWTEKVRQADVKKLIRDQLKIEKLFSRENYLIPFFEDSKTMLNLVKDYATGGYENVPWKTIAAIVGGIGYVLSPFDLIPDFLPAFGFFDDASLVKLLASAVAADAEKYRQWVRENEEALQKAKARRERMIRVVGWSVLALVVIAAIGVRILGYAAGTDSSAWADTCVTVLHVFEGILGLAIIGSMSYVLVLDFPRRHEKWASLNPPQINGSGVTLFRQAFAFWWWALFGWMGEKVKATRISSSLMIVKAAVRHPKAVWALVSELWRLKNQK